jgi:heptosyltransferase-3
VRILFITSSRIGDAVLTSGVLKSLIDLYSPQITLAAGPVAMPLFDDFPSIELRHILIKRGRLSHWYDLWKECRHVHWDWIIDMRGSAISYLLRSKKRSIWRKPNAIMHRVDAIAKSAGLQATPSPYIYIDDKRKIGLDTSGAPYFVMAPIANWCGKEWPMNRFIELARRLLEYEFVGWKIAVISSPDERHKMLPFIDAMAENIVDFPQKDHLLDNGALLQGAGFFIGNDSGLMHMSAALNVPTVGLFGPSPEVLYDPYGPKCIAVRTPLSYAELCKQKDENPNQCFMTSLTVDMVYDAIIAHKKSLDAQQCVA